MNYIKALSLHAPQVVMYDASGVRPHAGKQASVLPLLFHNEALRQIRIPAHCRW